MTGPVLLEPWYPAPSLRTVRHQVNNLLAPVTVAAELLDDGSDTSAMLHRSADRIRRISSRLALLVRPGEPESHSFDASALHPDAALLPAGTLLRGDRDRLTSRLLAELLANGAEIQFFVEESVCKESVDEGAYGSALCIRSTVAGSDLTDAELTNIPIPLTMRSGGLGLAIAALETHLHHGRVRIPGPAGVLDFLLPLG